jgi:hypothetical protein
MLRKFHFHVVTCFATLSTLLLAQWIALDSIAFASDYDKRAETTFGIELNLLWLAPPFKTIEVKAFVKASDSVDFVFGYGKQLWTYAGETMSPGTMNSDALILGVRGYLYKTNTETEYDTWLAYDRLTDPKGDVHAGFSQSNEFFAGYQFYYGDSYTYSTGGINAGFWAYKSYETAVDDRFIPTVLPKFLIGRGVK